MARIIYPINGKTYTAEDVEILNSPRTSGIYSVLDFDCSLSGNVLTIGKGLAWIKNGDFTGKCVAFTEPETLTLDSADSTKNRFDVVAIRYDASKTEPELVIIKGETGDIPMLPERKKETYLYELFLYAILRKAGEGSASFENLSDLRDDETFCGIMRDSVTSSVAPLYETLYDDETGMSLVDGHPIPVETDKYVSYVATVKNSDMIVEIPLYAFDDTSFAKKINGKRVISTSGGSETTFLITFECFPENISISDIFWSSDTGKGQAFLTKLVGIAKQPEGYVKVDDIYNPESHNAQSGEAVKQAIEEALENFEGGGGDVEIPENIETTDNKVTVIDEASTDEQYPSAKAVYNFVNENQVNVDGDINTAVLEDINEIKNSIGEKTYTQDITDTLGVKIGAYGNTGSYNSSRTQGKCTEIFEVKAGEKYFISGSYNKFWSMLVTYDDTKTANGFPLATEDSAVKTVVDYEYIIPDNVSYIACSTANTSRQSLVVKKEITELNNVQELVKETAQEVADSVSFDVTNVCPNGNFEDTTGWATPTGITLNIADNVATVTRNGTGSSARLTSVLDKDIFPHIENDAYFISAKVKAPKTQKDCKVAISTTSNDGNEEIGACIAEHDEYTTICGVKRFKTNFAGDWGFGIRAGMSANVTDFTFQLKEVTLIKVTDTSYTDEEIKNIYSAILEQNGGYINGTVNVAGVDGTLKTLGYEYANESIVTKNKVVTVGDNGDFPTINSALRYLSKFYPAYLDGGIECEVKILDGTIINEQIRLERIDLSHISITTDNADNTVQVDVTGWGGVTHDTRGNKPFFSAEYGARLPCIKCLFSCIVPEGGWVTEKYTDENGNEVATNMAVGYFCNRGSTGVIAGETTYSGSTSQVLANVGFENFYDNIIANNNSEIVLREAIARNAGRYGVMARHISRVSARSADITNCADTAAYADRSSMMDVRFADVSGSNNGLQVFNTSNMTAVETIANNIANIVADSREGSVINCAEMTIDNVKDVFKVLNGGTIIATSTAPTNVSGTLNSKERNTVDINGVIYG